MRKARSWLTERQRQRTDSTHIVAAVRSLNRLELVGHTLQHALNTLAQVAAFLVVDSDQP